MVAHCGARKTLLSVTLAARNEGSALVSARSAISVTCSSLRGIRAAVWYKSTSTTEATLKHKPIQRGLGLNFFFVCSEFVISVLESCFGELDLNEWVEDLNFDKV